MVGKTVSHYRILSELGAGGMGTVYKAEDLRLQRIVALKFLDRRATGDGTGAENQKSRFMHEARAAAALDHPNICGIYEIDEVDGETFLAMPFLEGRPLNERIAEGPLKLHDAVEIAIQTAEALDEAHSKGVVHRDIKPGNIMLLDRERGGLQVKLLDFGLARLSQVTRLTMEGSRLGTAAYMSPEQTQGESVDKRSDLWSLGVVLYEMIAGATPFPAEYEQALFYAIVHEEPEPLTALRTGVPMELERIVSKCMAKRPNERYQSATELVVDLKALSNSLSGSISPPSSRTATSVRVAPLAQTAGTASEQTPRRAAWPLMLTATAAAVFGALSAWLLMGKGSPKVELAPAEQPYRLRRMTWDGDLSAFPALSPDGTLLAYASDRGGRGDLDIWVQQVAGGDPKRITSDPADELQPSFSPDGSQIVFTRRPGGVYTVQALGGDPYLVSENAYAPSFDPEGKRVAYLRDGELYFSPVSMGEPVRLLAGMADFGPPLWSPDGESLLVHAIDAGGAADWVMAPLGGWTPKRLGAAEVFAKAGMSLPEPTGWSWTKDGLLIGDNEGDLIRVGVETDGDALRLSSPQRLTFGAGSEAMPSASETGLIAVAAIEGERDLWAVDLDRRGGAKGGPIQLTIGSAAENNADVTPDGERLVYISRRPAIGDIWTRKDARNSNLTADDADQRAPVLDPNGERIVYLAEESGKAALFVRPFDGGLGRKACGDCGVPTSWSPDGRFVLFEGGNPLAVWVLDLETGEKRAVLESEDGPVWRGRFSPDGKSVAFRFEGRDQEGLFIARFEPGAPTPRQEWSQITSFTSDDHPAWNVDGERLYFTSRREGSLDIWTVKLNRNRTAAADEPTLLKRFPLTRYSLDEDDQRLAVSRDRVVFSMTELSGSIWLLEPVDSQKER